MLIRDNIGELAAQGIRAAGLKTGADCANLGFEGAVGKLSGHEV
jgi:hypothetical protein